MVSRTLTWGLCAMCLVAILAAPASAAITTPGKYIGAVEKIFPITDESQTFISTVAGISFDPTVTDVNGNYDRIYICNRTTNNDKRGLYSVTISDESYSARLTKATPTTSTSYSDPHDVVVNSAGDVFVLSSTTAGIIKVTGASSGSPVETQILGNYNLSGDDDPISIDMLPAGFGLAGYDSNDLLMFDNGMDANDIESVVAVKADGSGHTIVWSANLNVSMRGAANPIDGKGYFLQTGLPTIDIGGTTYLALNRVGGDGVLETIAVNLPAGETVTAMDDAFAINPADGSAWISRDDGNSARTVFRVDTSSMTDMGSGVYLADATKEIVATVVDANPDSMNAGTNSLAFSPDGKRFALGRPDYVDQMLVFSVVPEPSTWVLLMLGLASLAIFRRK